MARTEPSRPLRLLIEQQIANNQSSFFDYGCGRGADIAHLKDLGIRAGGWDPYFKPSARKTKADVVAMTYVLNVIDKQDERANALSDAWALAKSVLAVSVRLNDERDEAHIVPQSDGWLTARGTFQKFFDHEEIKTWIESELATKAIPAAPGMFLIFRNTGERERYLANRYAVRIPVPNIRKSDTQFIQHSEVLQPLIRFFVRHGRLPKPVELENYGELIEIFGSIGRAFRVVEVVTDRSEWVAIAERRRIDVLVFLALRNLDGSFRMSDLDPSIQIDIRAHHRNFTQAASAAQKLLFSAGRHEAINIACRSSTVGKITPSALYVHTDAMQYVPALLKIYEGCAKRIIGHLPEANIIKLHRDSMKVSYLSYPLFDSDPHPAIYESFVVDLTSLKFKHIKYDQSHNLPILHRKEAFVHATYDQYDLFAKLTKDESEVGLLSEASDIGYRDQWNSRLESVGFSITDHILTRTLNHQDSTQSAENKP